MRKKLFFLILIGILLPISSYCQTEKPKVSLSFDDGSINSFPGHKLEDWNQLILSALQKHHIKAIFFVKGANMDNTLGHDIIETWNNQGHQIGNHTYHHPYYNSPKVSLLEFEMELLKADSLINKYSNYTKLFRFPYLKEGNTSEKRDGFRKFLKEQSYQIGHVTIDASDWYIDGRLIKKLRDSSKTDLAKYKTYYVDHIIDRALFYDSLALELTGRRINHNLLLHHNLSAALFLDDLISRFKDLGWEMVNTDKAYEDEIYKSVPEIIPAGESLIWALAKESGEFESRLRYPAEDGSYEENKMNLLGL